VKRLCYDGGRLPLPITISDHPLDRQVLRKPRLARGVKGHD
jgi:hypothetical protein